MVVSLRWEAALSSELSWEKQCTFIKSCLQLVGSPPDLQFITSAARRDSRQDDGRRPLVVREILQTCVPVGSPDLCTCDFVTLNRKEVFFVCKIPSSLEVPSFNESYHFLWLCR